MFYSPGFYTISDRNYGESNLSLFADSIIKLHMQYCDTLEKGNSRRTRFN